MAKKKITGHAATPMLTWRIVNRSEIPPRPPMMRKGYWDSVIRNVTAIAENEVLGLGLKFSDAYDVEGMASSARKAAARAGIKVSITIRGNLMYLWVAGRARKPVRTRSAPSSKE